MNRRVVVAARIALALLGCARVRPALAGEDGGVAPSPFAPLPRIEDAINAGMSPAARRAALYPGPTARQRETTAGPTTAPDRARTPVATAPLPRIEDAINAGLAPARVAARRSAPDPPPTGRTRLPAASPPPIAASSTPPAPAPVAGPVPDPIVAPASTAVPEGESLAALPALPIPDAPPPSVLASASPAAPAGPTSGDALPPLNDPPASDPLIRRTSAEPGPASEPPKPAADSAIQTASTADPTQVKAGPRRGLPITQIAATVGSEDITLSELQAAVKERIGDAPKDQITREVLNMIARSTLDSLIQRSLLVQAAKQKLKTDKNWDQMMKQFDKVWREHEQPQLIQKYHVTNEYELKEAMRKRGQSLQALREEFKLKTAATEFLRSEIVPKTKVDLPELRTYYGEHLHDFDRPARITWREAVVEVRKHKDRAEARRKAEEILGRLRRGEPFETVARAESEGPNAKKGGLWETTPDSYGIPAVNDALNALPPGQVSPILEAPESFHVVLVEERRQAGPAPFGEVQLQIRDVLREQKFERGVEGYFDRLRARTLIKSMFDGTASAPTLSNLNAPPSPPER